MICLPTAIGLVAQIGIYAWTHLLVPDYLPIDLAVLGKFSFDAHDGVMADIPPQFRALEGHNVELHGIMYSNASNVLVNEFQIIHYFVGYFKPSQVQERVFATVKRNRTTAMLGDTCTIRGTLHVGPLRNEEGIVTSLFRLDVESVEPEQPTEESLLEYPILLGGLLTGAAAIIAMVIRWLLANQRERRIRNKLCPNCGYDMRATPLRCPECGWNVVATRCADASPKFNCPQPSFSSQSQEFERALPSSLPPVSAPAP